MDVFQYLRHINVKDEGVENSESCWQYIGKNEFGIINEKNKEIKYKIKF